MTSYPIMSCAKFDPCLRWQHSDLPIKAQFYHLLLEWTLWNNVLVSCK